VNLVQVAGGILVQDHDIGFQPLAASILRLKDPADEQDVLVARYAHQQDRQVAGDAARPQTRLAELVRRDRVRSRS
jgi:hypothetical protein